jgi:hypothetical protein
MNGLLPFVETARLLNTIVIFAGYRLQKHHRRNPLPQLAYQRKKPRHKASALFVHTRVEFGSTACVKWRGQDSNILRFPREIRRFLLKVAQNPAQLAQNPPRKTPIRGLLSMPGPRCLRRSRRGFWQWSKRQSARNNSSGRGSVLNRIQSNILAVGIVGAINCGGGDPL